jgi:hypothetical protein
MYLREAADARVQRPVPTGPLGSAVDVRLDPPTAEPPVPYPRTYSGSRLTSGPLLSDAGTDPA